MEEVTSSRNQKLPGKSRIKTPEEFKRLFKSGKRLHTSNFIIYLKHNNFGYPRLGISVGKKVAAKSVERNRIKRLVRESFRMDMSVFNGNDIIIVVKKNIFTSKPRDIVSEIKSALTKLA